MNKNTCTDPRITKKTIQLLTGDREAIELDPRLAPIALAIDNPEDLPFLIERIFDIGDYEFIGDVRFGLVRVQIDCDLNMARDLEYYQRRQYVSQTIENILFGELLIEGIEPGDEEDNRRSEKNKAKDKCPAENPTKKGGKGKGKKADDAYQ